MNTNKNIYSYIAGIIDGEGYITIAKNTDKRTPNIIRHQYYVFVTVVNTSKRLIDLLQQTTQGSIFKKIRFNRKIAYNWTITSSTATKFLKKIKRYLVIKKEQANLAIEFQKLIQVKKRYQLNKNEIKKRYKIYKQMQKLHKNYK